MRVAFAGAMAAATLGSGIALAPSAEAATSIKAKAYSTAKAQIGDPYVYGATGPNAFDCSGLVYYSYKKNGKYLKYKSGGKWRTARTAQQEYWAASKISKSSRKPGDLVFFGGKNNIYHVGFYYGWKYKGKTGGFILHAPKTGRNVKVEKIWTSSVKYGRIN